MAYGLWLATVEGFITDLIRNLLRRHSEPSAIGYKP